MARTAAVVFWAMATSAIAADIPITSCDQTVPSGGIAVLQGDLSCTSNPAIRLGSRATLDLAGHTLAVSAGELVFHAVVLCERSCKVLSRIPTPGAIDGATDGSVSAGVLADKVLVDNVSFGGTFSQGAILGDRGVRASNVSIAATTPGPVGIMCPDGMVQAENVTVSGYGDGIFARKFRGTSVTVTGNTDEGIDARRTLRGENLVVTGNGDIGVSACGRAVLRTSQVTGNGAADVASTKRPSVVGTTCGTSRVLTSSCDITAETWAVCAP